MSVVINDFEVVAEPPPDSGNAPAEGAPAASPGPTPQDIRDIVRQQAERMARVRAH